jgi:hypothetical protein
MPLDEDIKSGHGEGEAGVEVLPDSARIPRQSCHRFQVKPATDSTAKLPLIPRQSCHPFHTKAATDSIARLPPIPGESCR